MTTTTTTTDLDVSRRLSEQSKPAQDADAPLGTRGVVVVGCDGSPAGQAAVDFAVREAVLRRARLVAVAAFVPRSHAHQVLVGNTTDELAGDTPAYIRALAGAAVDLAVSRAGGPGLDVELQVVSGRPSELLLAAAEHADVLVVGARGNGGWGRLLLGSVSTEVVHHAHLPVVVVPDAGTDGADRGVLRSAGLQDSDVQPPYTDH